MRIPPAFPALSHGFPGRPGHDVRRRRALSHASAVGVVFWMLFLSIGCGGDVSPPSCDDGACLTPPAPVCEGDRLTTWSAFGSCEDGRCAYPPSTRTCAAGCEAGACVPPSACEPAACEVPAPRCEGNDRIVASSPSCDAAGRCQFDEASQTCAFGCSDGACIDPCSPSPCAAIPSRCEGDVVVSSTATCSGEGVCTADESRDDCTLTQRVCLDGACVEPALCDDVDCGALPGPSCEGPIRVIPSSVACDPATGRCRVSAERENCSLAGLGCVDGECVDVGPCADVTCLDPPDAFCDGTRVVSFQPEGACSEGACAYSRETTDCAASSQFCFEGRCVAVDPCSSVSCDAGPAPRCDGNAAVRPVAPGACANGTCSFTETRQDCGSTGLFCFAGTCSAVDPCAAVSCNAPPTPRCEGNVVRRFEAAGTCSGGTCSYARADIDCAARGEFCSAGACVAANPCDGVACTSPPANVCDGPIAIRYSGAATCSGGTCDYASSRVNCGALGARCEDGACVLPDLCEGVVCDAPPGDVCDGRVAIAYPAVGTCAGGVCSYPPVPRNCGDIPGGFCQGGVCRSTDPCFERTCDEPPASVCDGRTAVHFGDEGSCTAGACDYPEEREDCSVYAGGFCFEGACGSTDPCFRVTCDAPPGPACSGDTLQTWALPGACEVGRCEYALTTVDCRETPDGYCFAGRCRSTDPCFERDCSEAPAPVCDGDVAVAFVGEGACDAGRCVFTEARTSCAETGRFCFQGACVERDACQGVVCNQPPAPVCVGTVARVATPAGTCAAGQCNYAVAEEDCGATGGYCVGGVCVSDDPCAGVACETPPAPSCSGDDLITWLDDGACIGGTCAYSRTRLSCATVPGGTCQAGACVVVDRCEGVSCDFSPTPSCDGNVAVTPLGGGTCLDGRCDFATTREDCGALGFFCFEGVCLDPAACELSTCNAPPAASCDGDRAQTWVLPGSCVEGSCAYNAQVVDCAARGEVCLAGACQPDPRCSGQFCNVAPEGRCEAEVALAFDPFGVCIDGGCEYTATSTNCAALGQTCFRGQCVAFDPCEGVLCNRPPADRCEGEIGVRWLTNGICARGDCVYDRVEEDCAARGEFCAGAGVCVPTDPCDGVDCEGDAGSICEGNLRVDRQFDGTCSGGNCGIARSVVDCAATGQVCFGGACVAPDPCRGVMCMTPPAPSCEGNTYVRFATPGTCDDGTCAYVRIPQDCSASGAFCSLGGCVPVDPCTTVACDTPPDPGCDGTRRLTFSGGSCANGVCDYDVTSFDCASIGQFCFGGVCAVSDPCEGVACATPPAPVCVGGVVRSSPGAGVCEAGECAFSTVETPCAVLFASFCDEEERAVSRFNHRCEGSTCGFDEVVEDCQAAGNRCVQGRCELPCGPCADPFPPMCIGNVAMRVEGPTYCEGPNCRQDVITESCGATGRVCEQGFCVAEPSCDLAACLPLPPAFCVDPTLRRVPISAFCGNGFCEYAVQDVECAVGSEVCVDGACVPATCDNVSCELAPSPRCESGISITFAGPGTCTGGACSFIETRVDCAAQDEFCFAGICEGANRCLDLTCTADREVASFCSEEGGASIAVTLVETGTCVDGGCVTESITENCTASGGLCVDGACVSI